MDQKLEAIILAGGLGTRMQNLFPDVPKCMIPVKGKPFLKYILEGLIAKGFVKVMLSVGHLKDQIINHFGYKFEGLEICYSTEDYPLGTGGAILKACEWVSSERFFAMNGDTLFLADTNEMISIQEQYNCDVVMALRSVPDSGRFGSVITNASGRITGFMEKGASTVGLINGGLYLFRKNVLISGGLPEVFSIEKDFFEVKNRSLFFQAYVSDAYFIDIGIPSDYKKAIDELPTLIL